MANKKRRCSFLASDCHALLFCCLRLRSSSLLPGAYSLPLRIATGCELYRSTGISEMDETTGGLPRGA